MSSTREGGPAFPQPGVVIDGEITTPVEYGEGGMSLRDYFAAKSIERSADAICDMLDEPPDHEGDTAEKHAEKHARAAYLMADAMLHTRNATAPQKTDSDVVNIVHAIQQWLQWGEDAYARGEQGGYFSGNGWAAATLRRHLETLRQQINEPWAREPWKPAPSPAPSLSEPLSPREAQERHLKEFGK